VQGLKIRLAVLAQRGFFAVYEEIIHLHRKRRDAARQQLNAQTLREGRLARGRRTSDQDDPDAVLAFVNRLGDFRNLHLVQRF